MRLERGERLVKPLSIALGSMLLLSIALPLFALVWSSSIDALSLGFAHPDFLPALRTSLSTTLVSLTWVIASGTPVAWWLATSASKRGRAVELLIALPIVIPPAVMGVALLETFGRRGLFGPVLESLGVSIPFTERAVVLAQFVVSAPFYVEAAATAFRKVDPEMLTVARTLGATRSEAFFRIAVPLALPGLVAGASLAWARALGEFGATLLFAGNRPGVTQTMPLAIFSALESDVRVAVVFSLVLAAAGAALLLALRLLPGFWQASGRKSENGPKEPQ
jgi:molybdate transport system permease protein